MKPRKQPHIWTEEEIQDVFQWWYDHDCHTALTARECGVARSTVFRFRKKYNWDERAKKIKKSIQQGYDRKRINKEISNVKMAKAVLKKEVAAYLDRKHKPTGNLNAIVSIMRYIDEVQGAIPTEGTNGDNIVNIIQNDPNEVERMLRNALAGIEVSGENPRGPFTPLSSGDIRSSE